jgi:deoxyribose-phosphate aldolase
MNKLNKYIDHTNLKPFATKADIEKLCADAREWDFASVCVNPCDIPLAKKLLAGSNVMTCTVIGFPNGYSTTSVKIFETRDAVQNGADEIDMVINIGWVKEGRYDDVLDEIKRIREACRGKILKVIIETCLLTEDEKIRMCEVVNASGADYIKTSTGFSKAGATPEDIAIFARYSAPHVKIKAAGGIRSLADAENYIALGASRLGTSSIVKLAKGQENGNGGY